MRRMIFLFRKNNIQRICLISVRLVRISGGGIFRVFVVKKEFMKLKLKQTGGVDEKRKLKNPKK